MGKDALSSLIVENVVQGVGNKKLRIDREKGIIHGVKVLGHTSRNGRVYEEAALRDCARLYEGVPVHFGHLTKDYGDRCGSLHNCRPTAKAVYGDWHLNKGHRLYEQVMHDAEFNPRNLQLSHEVSRENAEVNLSESVERVQRVHKVNSVAVVTDGATNESLTEEKVMNLDDLKKNHQPLLEAYASEITKPVKEELDGSKAKVTELEGKLAEVTKLLESVTTERDQLTKEKADAARRASIAKTASDLGAGELSEALIETYMLLSDDAIKVILEDRATQVKAKAEEKPESISGAASYGYTRESVPSLFRKN